MKTDDPKRYHIYLDKDDTEWLREIFGEHMKLSAAIRAVIRAYRKTIEARVAASNKSTSGNMDNDTTNAISAIRRDLGDRGE